MISLKNRLAEKWFQLRNCGYPYILSVEAHLCDHCNLNCRGCTHLCPLVTEPVFNDLEEYKRDILTLAGKLNVHTIHLMGGEPLLHPLVIDFMRVTREAYPHRKIVIITNGLLLLKMSESFWRAMYMYRVRLRWSVYPTTRGQFEEIRKCCKKYRVFFENGSIGRRCVESFHSFSVFSPEGTENPERAFKGCTSRNCVNLYHGKLYTCPACYVFRANNYFHANHEVPEGWDIYKYSGKELQSFLNKPIPFCRYCHHAVHPKSFPWEVSKRKAEEWM